MLTHATSGPGMGHGLALTRRRSLRISGDALLLAGIVIVLALAVWWPR